MAKRVLDVGNCALDHATITQLIESSFNADVVQVHDGQQAINELSGNTYDLVLVNRLMDRDQSPGIDIIKRIKSDPQLSSVPVMLITNFSDHQKLAEAAGAEPGFGKRELGSPDLADKLRTFLQ
jgi:CheY-like chemotaxis protein